MARMLPWVCGMSLHQVPEMEAGAGGGDLVQGHRECHNWDSSSCLPHSKSHTLPPCLQPFLPFTQRGPDDLVPSFLFVLHIEAHLCLDHSPAQATPSSQMTGGSGISEDWHSRPRPAFLALSPLFEPSSLGFHFPH